MGNVELNSKRIVMKFKIIISGIAVIAASACSANVFAQTKKPATVKKKATVAAKPSLASAEDLAEGNLLISKSDCMACHGIDNKMVGPSYVSVAEKYQLNQVNISGLSKKIITGGSGNWGTVPMTPHPSLLPADADKMVKYILSLKKAL
jgi:cytochrome c